MGCEKVAEQMYVNRLCKSRTTDQSSESVAIHPHLEEMVIDSGENRIDLVSTATGKRIRTFPTGAGSSLGRQVAFTECGEAVVGGSDHGIVYIFDRKNGDVIDHLPHGDSAHMAQTIAVSN